MGEEAAGDSVEYLAENIFRVPPEARRANLKAQARQPTVGQLVDAAMAGIERDNPALANVLPKDYAREGLDKQRLGQLIDMMSNIRMDAEGKKGGGFYALRRTLDYDPMLETLAARTDPGAAVLVPGCADGDEAQ